MDLKPLIILKLFFLLISCFNPNAEGDIPFGRCANPTCSAPISRGVTIMKYSSVDTKKLSVEPGETVEIFVKDYGAKKDLLGVEVRGVKGYVSKIFIKEMKVYAKNLVPAVLDFRNPAVSSSRAATSQVYHHDSTVTDGDSTIFTHTEIVQSSFSSLHSNKHQEWNSPSESLQSSHASAQFSSESPAHIDMHSQSEMSNFPEQSSHFDLNSGNILSSSDAAGVRSDNSFSSQSHTPEVRHSSLAQDHTLQLSHSESNFKHPSSFDYLTSTDYDYDPSTSMEALSFSQQSVPPQSFQSWHNDYSSYYDGDYNEDIDDEETSKTLAMLSKRGVDNTGLYVDSYPDSDIGVDSQNNKLNYGTKDSEPSQYSFHTPIQSSTLSASKTDFHPSFSEENKVLNSETVKNDKYDIKAITDKSKVINFGKKEKLTKFEKRENKKIAEVENKKEKIDDEIDDIKDNVIDKNSEIYSEKNIESSKTSLESSMKSITITSHENSRSTVESSNMGIDEISAESSLSNKEEIPSEEFVSVNTMSDQFSESNSIDSVTTQSEIYPSVSQNSIEKNLNTTFENFDNEYVNPSTSVTEEESTQAEDLLNRNNVDSVHILHTESIKDSTQETDIIMQEENAHLKENATNEVEAIIQNVDLIESVNIGVDLEASTYQTRNLKGELLPNEDNHSDTESSLEENNTEPDSNLNSSLENSLDSIKSIIDSIMSWVPEPLYSAVMDLQNKGISPRVPVFTALCGFIIIFLIVPVFYIKEWSKENKLSAQLVNVEKKAYTLSAANVVLEEKLECAKSEITNLQVSLDEERNIASDLKSKFEIQTEEFESIKSELESYLEEFDSLRAKENEYLSLLNVQNKEKEDLMDQKNSLEKIIKDQEDNLTTLSEQLQESESSLKELEKEKVQLIQLKEDDEKKLVQFELNCNQLLQEAEVWNLRVNELTSKLNDEKALKEETEVSLKVKDEEIESLKQLVETFKMFDEIEDPEEEEKAKEEKLQILMKSSMILNQLKKQEDENKILSEQLGKEKEKILEMEVEMLEARSEIDKLKVSYNQALQDRTEAQTKLDILTNYFKDKEIQLQKQLGAQEAVRQKKEEDASSAERRICLIEQENASYKYQVASMKQEMEETERNLKSQIAVQEKKAHESWIAARAAERKLEDMKQEVTQLRQRLTLLEREQENWVNSSRDEIVRPVPKRMNDESGNQDLNASERSMFHPPLDRLLPPPPHMMLPPDRPLPPLPPPLPPMFLPPIERHFRPQPWHIPSDPNSDFRTTPPEFITGRESTPPRGRPSAILDGSTGPHASSPLTTDTRDSRNSTPPHLLPDFHDVPPQPGRPFYPPPLNHPRLQHMHPSYRRDGGPQGHKRLDNPSEYNSKGSQPPPPPSASQEQWQHSRV